MFSGALLGTSSCHVLGIAEIASFSAVLRHVHGTLSLAMGGLHVHK